MSFLVCTAFFNVTYINPCPLRVDTLTSTQVALAVSFFFFPLHRSFLQFFIFCLVFIWGPAWFPKWLPPSFWSTSWVAPTGSCQSWFWWGPARFRGGSAAWSSGSRTKTHVTQHQSQVKRENKGLWALTSPFNSLSCVSNLLISEAEILKRPSKFNRVMVRVKLNTRLAE